jgi:hypothetical protein
LTLVEVNERKKYIYKERMKESERKDQKATKFAKMLKLVPPAPTDMPFHNDILTLTTYDNEQVPL